MPTRQVDPHTLARDATLRPPAKGLAGGVVCKACGGDQVIPIPIWTLIVESADDSEVMEVPVALVCLGCWSQSIYQTRWRPGEVESDG